MRFFATKDNIGEPPIRLFNFPFADTVLWFLVIVSLGLLLEAIVSKNKILIGCKFLHEITLLDINTSIIILYSLLSILALRNQFILSSKPHLQFSFYSPDIETLEDNIDYSTKKWSCVLKNNGQGPAIIEWIKYYLRFNGEQKGKWLYHEDVITQIKNNDLELYKDYDLPRKMRGDIVPPYDESLLLTFGKNFLAKVKELNVRIVYYSTTDRKYYNDIPCTSNRKDILSKVTE